MIYLFSALPVLGVFLAALAVIAWLGITLSKPTISVLVLIAILVAFSGSSYGQLDAERTIYSRGTGMLYFSILNFYLWGLGVAIALRNAFSPVKHDSTPLAKYFAAFAFLIVANAFVAGISDDPSLHVIDAFAYNGMLNIINMAILFYVCVNVFGTQSNAQKFITFLLIGIGLRGIFGMVRWAFFGGDPANVYDNIERTGSKLTFFDTNDGFLAVIAIYCSAWLLSYRQNLLGKKEQVLLWMLLLLETAIIVLSFRRSTLVSLGLASVLFIVLLPAKKRLAATLLSVGMLVCGSAVLTALRLSKVRGSATDLGFFYDLFGKGKGFGNSARVLEYTETWRSLGDDWLFGKGMWGILQSNLAELSYHAGNFGFVHSGFGHVLLKGGLFGLVMFIGLLASFTVYYLKARKQLTGKLQMLADVGAAGVLFWLPTLLIGTPIVEYRSMQMLGLALALPFIAARAAATIKAPHAAA